MAEDKWIDLADGNNREEWIRHPVWGDPSFDTFKRVPGNPIHRGATPYEWPVNGFLFEDPVSGNWYVYIGHYPRGYWSAEATCYCSVMRSKDRGQTWESVGPAIENNDHLFAGETSAMSDYPDVSVVFADGWYHMVFDWLSKNSIQNNGSSSLHNPGLDSNSGVGYARSRAPEGPFIPNKNPLITTRDVQALVGKYRRMYASTLIKRKNDWLVLTLTDSHDFFGWALVAMTAAAPEGPYKEPQLVLHPECPGFHPPLMEFFPAFTHDDWLYAPATSVAQNRDFNCLFRARTEDAHRPDGWELYQHGSVWHSIPVENEHAGLWGQTFSGFVDSVGMFNVMFPSKDRADTGTINIAAREWDTPYNNHGFEVAAHGGATFVRTHKAFQPERIEVTARVVGQISIVWGATGPMGSDKPRSGATLHRAMLSSFSFLEIVAENETDGLTWRTGRVDALGEKTVISEGSASIVTPGGPAGHPRAEATAGKEVEATIQIEAGTITVGVNGETTALPVSEHSTSGCIGLSLQPHSWVEVSRMKVLGGVLSGARHTLMYTEALLAAAQGFAYWENRLQDSRFRYREGAVSIAGSPAAAKWLFSGTGFVIWAPQCPSFGQGEVFVDGRLVDQIDFCSTTDVASRPVFQRTSLSPGNHAVTIRPIGSSQIPVDSCEFW